MAGRKRSSSAARKPKPSELIAQEMIERLKNGTAPWTKPWKAGDVIGAPINALTGRAYRGANRMMLEMAQMDMEDPRWMTYRQAQDLGAQVRKGEKGIPISIWITTEKRLIRDEANKPVVDSEGNKQYKNVRRDIPYESGATVFHASQVDELAPFTPHVTPEWQRHANAEAVLNASGASIHHSQGDRAFYRPYTDEIHLPQRHLFPSADRYYATALHELGHWTGHPSRLDRDLLNQGDFGSEGYAREELRAELSSYMIGKDLAIGHDPDRHAGYIESWIRTLEDDPKEIMRAAKDAEQIRHYVLAFTPLLHQRIEHGLQHDLAYNHAPSAHAGNADDGVYVWCAQDEAGQCYYTLARHESNDAQASVVEMVACDQGGYGDADTAISEGLAHGEQWCSEHGVVLETEASETLTLA